MAIYDSRYEVAWRLSEDGNEEDVVDVRDEASSAVRESFEPLARFAGLLAGAEVAAITLCRGEGLIIELTDPPSSWLTRGAFMRAQPSNSTDDSWSVATLLAGTSRWCWCKPPAGFCSAALIGGPSLVASQRLLLVANREGRLSEVNLGLAASYLAQAVRPAPGLTTGHGRRVVAEDAGPPEANIPEANVPEANMPEANIPEANMPEANIPETGPRVVPRASAPGGGSEPTAGTQRTPPWRGEDVS